MHLGNIMLNQVNPIIKPKNGRMLNKSVLGGILASPKIKNKQKNVMYIVGINSVNIIKMNVA